MLALYVVASVVSVACACVIQYQHILNSVNAMLVIYLRIKLVEKLPIFLASCWVEELAGTFRVQLSPKQHYYLQVQGLLKHYLH